MRLLATCVLAGALLANGACSGSSADSGVAEPTRLVPDLPVLTSAERWEWQPAAEVRGRLTLQEGCLLLSGEVVFWPYGTTWDESVKAVVFEDHPAAAVGERFVGGGGHYSAAAQVPDTLPEQGIVDCLRRTGTRGVLYAYPAE